MINLFDCKGCEQRRALIAAWARGMADWARDPTRHPRPGSKEWLEKLSVNQEGNDGQKVDLTGS